MLRIATIFLSLVFASPLYANCLVPDLEILGTIPEDGAIDVPLDSQFIIFSSIPASQVLLNGNPQRTNYRAWRLDDLKPWTEYQVEMGFHSNSRDVHWRTVRFTTGDNHGSPKPPRPAVAEPENLSPSFFDWQNPCHRITNRLCPDTGEEPFVFKVENRGVGAQDVRGWLINPKEYHIGQMFWPRECGEPIFQAHPGKHLIYSFNEFGHLSDSVTVETPNPYEMLADKKDMGPTKNNEELDVGHSDQDPSMGCATTRPRRGLGWILFVLVGMMLERRRS